MMILIRDFNQEYFLVPSIEPESCPQCEEIEEMTQAEIEEKYPDLEICDCDPDQYFYSYWNGHNWVKLYAEDFWETFLFEEIETLYEDDGFSQKLCKDDEKYFILSSDERSYHPDKINYILVEEIEEMKKADDIKEFLRDFIII